MGSLLVDGVAGAGVRGLADVRVITAWAQQRWLLKFH